MMACCCDLCTIVSDTFDAALANFTQIGSPTVAAGLLDLDAGDGVITVAAAASANDGTKVLVYPQTASGTATLRLYAAYTDSNNYLFGELAIAASAGTIRIGQVVGGSSSWLTDAETLEDTGAELNARSTLALCWQPGESQTSVSLSEAAAPTDATGTNWPDLPDNIEVDDTDYSQYTGSFNAGDITAALTARGYGFLIPPGSTIDGIGVDVWHADLSTDSDYVIDWTVKLVNRAGTDVGDDKALETLIGGTSPQYRGYGGATDDWNAGLTWRDINHGNFGVLLQYKNDGPDASASVIVDFVGVTVWYTTPDRKSGRLVLSYGNTAAPNTNQCVRATGIYDMEGLKGGVEAIAGDWDTTEFHYLYLLHDTLHPTCTDCACDVEEGPPCECCDPAFPAAEAYTVDLDVGGWTNDACSYCDTINGVYVLEAAGDCVWNYGEALADCPDAVCDCADHRALGITLWLEDDGLGGCKWMLRVAVLASCDPADTGACGSSALYESSSLASDEDCQTMPVTLSKVGGAENDEDCSGTLPATVDIDLS